MAAKKTPQKTPKKEDVFLLALAESGNVTRAAKKAKLSRTQLYNKRKADLAFAKIWDEAEALGVSALEDEARRRAYDGWLEPVFHKGVRVGTVRKFSDTLLIVLLKAHKPEKYRENMKIKHGGQISITMPDTVKDLFDSIMTQGQPDNQGGA